MLPDILVLKQFFRSAIKPDKVKTSPVFYAVEIVVKKFEKVSIEFDESRMVKFFSFLQRKNFLKSILNIS